MAVDEQKVEQATKGESLYLGAMHFDGDPGELLPGYHRMLERFQIETLDVHLCIVRDDGLTVFDACPGKAVHEQFTKSDAFRDGIAAAGLPEPRIEGLGDVRVAHLSHEVRP
jgi:hypothetical protein